MECILFTQHTSLAEKQEMSFDIIFIHSICFMEITFRELFPSSSSSMYKQKSNKTETNMETTMICQTTFSL